MAKTSKSLNKRIVSSILLCSFIMMPVSAAVVHASHGNAISHTWLHLHVIFAVTFTVAGVYHAVNHWRTLKFYIFR